MANAVLKFESIEDRLPENEDFSLSIRIKKLSKPILESIPGNFLGSFKHDHLKFFEDYYNVQHNTITRNHDALVRVHTNNTLIVSIAKGHDIIRNNKKIVEIDFGKKNDLINKNYGKSKKAAPVVGHNSILCRIKCEGDIMYPVYTGARGKLIEINENILKNPNELISSYKNLGYLAIMQPTNIADVKKSLLNEQDYEDYLIKQQKNVDS